MCEPPASVVTARAPKPVGAYSQGVLAGNFLFTAGQGPVDPDSGRVLGETVEEQTLATLTNILRIVEAAGGSVRDIVKVTAHLLDLDDFAAYDRAYREFFGGWLPARTTVGSSLNGILVEIEAVAYIEKPQPGPARREDSAVE
jgi:2-iminobutanoate/2-iminopropanoate deaminase